MSDNSVGPVGDPRNDPVLELVGLCHLCKHFRSVRDITCDAFPSGIPAEVLVGNFLHTREYPGDNGIIFEHKNT